VKEGIDRGEKAIHIIDPNRLEEHRGRLKAGGIPVRQAEDRGQLEISGWDQVYMRGGEFDEDATLAFMLQALVEARKRFPRTRVMGEVEWALGDQRRLRRLVSYESRVNAAVAGFTDPLVCTYDRTKFNANLAMDIYGVHAAAVIGGVLQVNPVFGAPRLGGTCSLAIRTLRRRYLSALLAGSRRDALELLVDEGLWSNVPLKSLYLDVLQPAMYEIGRLWHTTHISVPQACLAAEICKAGLEALHPHLPCEENNGKLVVVACVEGDLHDIGAHMVADFLEMEGFDVRFLGANIPTASLVALVEEQPPQLLALSATLDSSLPALRSTIDAIRKVGRGRIPVAGGGQLFARKPGLHLELGMSLFASNAAEMAAAARSLLGRTLH
jgi:methanogenic corrinoid protein MtbC1